MDAVELYTTPAEPASFTGLSTFYKNHKGLKRVQKDLLNNEVYSVHRRVVRKFPRRKTIAKGINDQWQIDLLDIKKIKVQNSHMAYILTCIDVFSRYAWAVAIKNKEAKTVRDAFEHIFSTTNPPRYIYSDWGNEFRGECRKLFKEKNIIQIDTKSSKKAAIIERFNRTLRDKISKYQTFKNSKRFVNVLDDLVKSYNATVHSITGLRPDQVNLSNEAALKLKLYGDDDPVKLDSTNQIESIRFKFKIGDYARMVIDKTAYEKGSTANWSKEIYIIDELKPTAPPQYVVKTLKGKRLDWSYYAEELQHVSPDDFPFDTLEIIDQEGDISTVVKLNSDNPRPVRVKTKLLK